jgi:prepilin-type N-terminal cleavage/methylation domain-containing protein
LVRQQIRDLEQQLVEKKSLVNSLCHLIGSAPLFPDAVRATGGPAEVVETAGIADGDPATSADAATAEGGEHPSVPLPRPLALPLSPLPSPPVGIQPPPTIGQPQSASPVIIPTLRTPQRGTRNSNRRAWTLIELLVVLAIVGLPLALLLPAAALGSIRSTLDGATTGSRAVTATIRSPAAAATTPSWAARESTDAQAELRSGPVSVRARVSARSSIRTCQPQARHLPR